MLGQGKNKYIAHGLVNWSLSMQQYFTACSVYLKIVQLFSESGPLAWNVCSWCSLTVQLPFVALHIYVRSGWCISISCFDGESALFKEYIKIDIVARNKVPGISTLFKI